MRIVVTGALGHIGSRLIREIPSEFPGGEIVLFDNLLTQRYCSLFDLPANGRYRFIEGDVLRADLPSVFKTADAVIHLAAITDATNSFSNQELVADVNLHGSERVARACLEAACPMVFVSTTSVYGTQAEVVDEACPEADLKPQSPYAESKLLAERMLHELGKNEGLRFIVCRFGTIFGTSVGMRFHTAINKFCWQAAMGQPISVWRTALDQKRPYLDLADALGVFMFVLKKRLYDGRIYNVVTTNTSVRTIVECIRKHVPDLRVEYVDQKIMNQLSYHVASERIRKAGFEFKGDLAKGIAETLRLIQPGKSS